MTFNAYRRAISGDTKVAAPSRSALLAHPTQSIFPDRLEKTQNRSFSRPFGRETALRAKRLTKSEEKETIIINCSDRSTYPEEKSVQRSGATPNV